MRFKFLIPFALMLLGFSFQAEAQTPRKVLLYSYALDTITNTESDTIYIGTSSTGAYSGVVDFQSLYAGQWTFIRTNISGTSNVALKIEQTPLYTGSNTYWTSIATGAGTGATAEAITVSEMLGRRYRVILTGTGSQLTSYRVYFSAKLKT